MTGRLRHRLATGMAIVLFVLLASCRDDGPSEAARALTGPAGQATADLMTAHGGLQAFAALVDLEYDVVVEQFDASGVLLGSSRELHRFATSPPRRYLLRRSGSRVTEYGLLGDEGWVRVDGGAVQQQDIVSEARRELTVLSFLHRAPFVLADPGWEVTVEDDLLDGTGQVVWRRLAAVRRPDVGGVPERYVLLIDDRTGRIGQVIFETGQAAGAAPLRVATARETREVGGVSLIGAWSLAPADAAGRPIQIDDTAWQATEVHPDNGFTDDLYRSR